MSDFDQKQRDYARMVAETTNWSTEDPVMTYNGWRVHVTPKLDLRIVVALGGEASQPFRIIMGVQTWAAISASGFSAAQRIVALATADLVGVWVIPWDDPDMSKGVRRLGWGAHQDTVSRLVEDANQLLMQAAAVNDANRPEWYRMFAGEFARIRDERDRLAEAMRRLDAVMDLAESTIVDAA